MPKDIDQVEKAKELVINGDGAKLAETPNKTSQTAEDAMQTAESTTQTADKDAELSLSSTSYYSIVLASRVTKHNAANYAERLQNKGFKQARVLITENNVKVIYGTYNSESEAYAALKNLKDNEAFADGWITKVNE